MELLPSVVELSHTLAWTLLHFLWQGLLIGGAYEVGKRLCKGSTRKQHNFALGALIALLLAPILTFQYLTHRALPAAELSTGVMPALTQPLGNADAILATSGTQIAAAAQWTTLLATFWLLGVVLAGLILLRDVRQLRRAIATSTAPPPALLALLDQQMARLAIRRPVRLRLTSRVHSPGVYGFLRPIILLPVALALSLPRDQLETLIAHELAHVRRADYLGNLLAITARTLFYFHPVVHRVCRDLEMARETLCDDMVIGLHLDPLKYARALSKAEEFRQQVPMPLLTATGGILSQRVRRILNLPIEQKQDRASNRAPVLLIVASILTIAVAGQRLTTLETSGFERPEMGLPLHLLRQVTPTLLPPVDASEMTRPRLVALAVPTVIDTDATGASQALVADAPNDAALYAQMPAETLTPSEPIAGAEPVTSVDRAPVATPALDLPRVLEVPTVDVEAADLQAAIDPVKPINLPQSGSTRPEPIRIVTPDFPRTALRARVEGSVRLEYQIASNGRPTNIRATGPAVQLDFVDAAIGAMSRWRFPAGSVDSSRIFVQEFDFRLEGSDPSSGQCELPTGTRVCRRDLR